MTRPWKMLVLSTATSVAFLAYELDSALDWIYSRLSDGGVSFHDTGAYSSIKTEAILFGSILVAANAFAWIAGRFLQTPSASEEGGTGKTP